MATFDLLDYYAGSPANDVKNIIVDGVLIPSRGSPWVAVPVVAPYADEVKVSSGDGLLTVVYTHGGLSVPQNFTFEFWVRPEALPPNLNDLTKSLLFIAVFDKQDNAGGLLISREGLAVVSAAGNSVMPISGSQNLFEEGGTPYAVRMVVDGVNNLMNLYITKESDLAIYGHVLRYTTVAPASPASVLDQARIEVIGQPQSPVSVRIRAMRLHGGLLIPNKRPIAHPGQDQTASTDSMVQLDGTSSYDPEGQAVTCKWFLTKAPTGSAYTISGKEGFTTGAGVSVLKSSGSPWSATNAPGLQPGDVLIVQDVKLEVSGFGWAVDPLSKKYKRTGAFVDGELHVTTAGIPGGAGGATGLSWVVLHQDLCFSGPSIPSTKGAGGFAVDDGMGASDVCTTLQDALAPWTAAGCPYLQPGDLLVLDGATHVVSTSGWVLNTVTGWYYRGAGFDPTKLLVTTETIPVGAGMRWEVLHMSHAFSDRDKPKVTWVPDVAGLYAFDLVVNDGELDSLPVETLVNVGEQKVPLGFVPNMDFLWRYLPDFWNMVEDKQIVEVFWGGMAQAITAILMTAWQLDYSKSIRDIPRLFQRRWVNYDTDFFEPPGLRKKQKLRMVRGPIVGDVDLAAGAALDGKTLQLSWDGWPAKTVTFSSVSQPSPTVTASEVVSQINAAVGSVIASLEVSGAVENLKLQYGGLLEVLGEGTANGLILGAFAVDTYIQNELRGVGQVDPGNSYLFDDTTGVGFSAASSNDILAFGGVGYLFKRSIGWTAELYDRISTSTAGSWVLAPTVELFSSDVEDALISAGDIAYFNVEHKNTGKMFEVACNVYGAAGHSIGFDAAPLYYATNGMFGDFYVWLHRVRRCVRIPVDATVKKIPRLQEVILDPPSVLQGYDDFNIECAGDGGAIVFKEGLFDIENPPPEHLWAEVTYLDNSAAIEANFGDAVGLRADAYAAATSNGDYLSAVQGLWFSFFHGPTLFNMKLGVQVLLGLPFTEVAGTIEDINLNFKAQYARVLIRDKDDRTTVRSYLVPRTPVWESYGESPIGLKPGTDRAFEVGDAVAAFQPLSRGVEVSDYISSPTWWKTFLPQEGFGELHKFFHFLVRADVDIFPVPNLLLAAGFIGEIRPGYTLEKLVALKRLPPTEIDTADTLTFAGVKYLFDDPACPSPGSYRWDDVDGGGVFSHQWDPLMGAIDILPGAAVDGLTLDMTVGVATSTVTFSGVNPISPQEIADQINLEFGLEVAGLFFHDGEQYLTLQYDRGVSVARTGTANALLGMYRVSLVGKHQLGNGINVVNRTLTLEVAGASYSVLFAGVGLLSAADVVSQINAVVAGVASLHTHLGRVYLRLDDPLGVIVTGGTAARELGLLIGYSAKSMHVWDRRRSKCPTTYMEASMAAQMPQTVLVHPANMGPAVGTYFIPWDWIWAWDGSGGADVQPLSGPDTDPPAPYGPPLDGAGAAAYPGTIQWDGKGAAVGVGPPSVSYGAYPSGTYHRIKVL